MESLGIFWNLFGIFWNLLDYFGIFLESFGIFWILFGIFWNLLDSFGIFWNLLEFLSSLVGLGLRSSSELLSCSWSIWGALGLESISSLVVFGNPISYIDTILFKTNANYLHQFSISLYQIVYNSSHGQKTKQSVKKQSF